VLLHSPIMREERKRIEKKLAAIHPQSPAVPVSAASSVLSSQHAHSGLQGQSRRGGMRGEAADELYHRDAPATSHHYKLYQPPG